VTPPLWGVVGLPEEGFGVFLFSGLLKLFLVPFGVFGNYFYSMALSLAFSRTPFSNENAGFWAGSDSRIWVLSFFF